MIKTFTAIFFVLTVGFVMAQPANNNCASATSLTIGGALSCSQTTLDATLQAGECYTNYAGSSETSVWYTFTASNDSTVLNFVQTNVSNLAPLINVYGPGVSCLPACASIIQSQLSNGDPGNHMLLTGLTAGSTYLIQIQGNDGGGPNDGETNFCISVANPAANSGPSGANQIDECGTAFTSSTNGGYFQNGTSTGFNNLDGNNTTTCSGCTAGDDTPFIINNVSWSYFCSLTAGTWQITVNGISGCTLAAPNQGVQASVFTGTTGALTNQGNSQNPISPGGSWTSGTLTVNAGECAYLMIDGFAGDACNYSVTLTNLSGGCIVLPIALVDFNVYKTNQDVKISWTVGSESDVKYYQVERSLNGSDYTLIDNIESIGNHNNLHTYETSDRIHSSDVYYQLSAIDINGDKEILAVKFIQGEIPTDPDYFLAYPNPSDGQFNLEFYNPMSESTATVLLYNTSGNLEYKIQTEIFNGMNNISVTADEIPAGNYILKVVTENRVYTERLFISAD